MPDAPTIINIKVTGEDEISQFLRENADTINLAGEKLLSADFELVGLESVSTSTGVTVRAYITEAFRDFLAAVRAGDIER